jgi:hypothetical protein
MMSLNNSAGAHSTTTSASGSKAEIGKTFTGYAKVFIKSFAFSWFLAETAVNTTPGISPFVKRLANDLPIAPNPAMATRRGLVVDSINTHSVKFNALISKHKYIGGLMMALYP